VKPAPQTETPDSLGDDAEAAFYQIVDGILYVSKDGIEFEAVGLQK
jgi:hypothetical protein